MITYELFSTLIPLSGLFLAKIGVDRSREPCPTTAIVYLTDEKANSSRYRNTSGDSFSPEAMCTKNGTTFGCLCDFETCLQSCCPEGFASFAAGFASNWEPNCNETDVEERRTFNFVSSRRIFEKYDEAVSVITDNPYCYPIVIDDWVEKDYVSALNVGSMNWSFKFEDKIGFQERTPNIHRKRLTGTDVNVSWTSIYSNKGGINWLLIGLHVSVLFMLPTFITYSVIPELKNLQGSIFRRYLASYIALVLTISIFLILLKVSALKSAVTIFSIFITFFGAFYFGFAAVLWLNVMSFEIWRAFRIFKYNQELDIRRRQKVKVGRYCIYSWGGAAVFTLFMNWLIFIQRSLPALAPMAYLLALLIVTIAICNTFFYVSTSITIRKRKKETEHLVDGVNNHDKKNEQWFILYLRLFIRQGGSTTLCVVLLYKPNEIFGYFVYAVHVLQSIAIYFVFVWKDDVKHLCRKRFGGLLRTMCSFFRRYPTRNSSIV